MPVESEILDALLALIEPDKDGLTPLDRELAKAADDATYTPPKGVQQEAQRALDWLKEGEAGKGFTAVGRKRASDLASGKAVSLEIIKRMASYLARHKVDEQGKGWNPGEDGYPSPGRVAWAAWGGDPAVSWTNSILDSVEKAEALLELVEPDQDGLTQMGRELSKADWDPDKHPRGAGGRFGSGDGSDTKSDQGKVKFGAGALPGGVEPNITTNSESWDGWHKDGTWLEKKNAYSNWSFDNVRLAVNSALQKGKSSDEMANTELTAKDFTGKNFGKRLSVDQYVKSLDAIIASQHFAQDSTVFRGMAVPKDWSVKVGDVITDKGFTSTTSNPEYAKGFADLRSGRPSMVSGAEVETQTGTPKEVLMNISVPKGQDVANIDGGINEMLLPRGSSFTVTGVSTKSNGDTVLNTKIN